jgi:hypothetical protein
LAGPSGPNRRGSRCYRFLGALEKKVRSYSPTLSPTGIRWLGQQRTTLPRVPPPLRRCRRPLLNPTSPAISFSCGNVPRPSRLKKSHRAWLRQRPVLHPNCPSHPLSQKLNAALHNPQLFKSASSASALKTLTRAPVFLFCQPPPPLVRNGLYSSSFSTAKDSLRLGQGQGKEPGD